MWSKNLQLKFDLQHYIMIGLRFKHFFAGIEQIFTFTLLGSLMNLSRPSLIVCFLWPFNFSNSIFKTFGYIQKILIEIIILEKKVRTFDRLTSSSLTCSLYGTSFQWPSLVTGFSSFFRPLYSPGFIVLNLRPVICLKTWWFSTKLFSTLSIFFLNSFLVFTFFFTTWNNMRKKVKHWGTWDLSSRFSFFQQLWSKNSCTG